MRYAIRLILISVLIIIPQISLADITFTSYFWSTTFDCTEWSQPSVLSCDGVESEDDTAYSNSQGSQINTDGNYTSGGGGGGYRTYFSNTHNEMSSMPRIEFPAGVTEFWLRWYYRVPNGQTISSIQEHKLAYIFSNSTGHSFNWPAQGLDQAMLHNTGAGELWYENLPGGSWSDVYGGSTATGEWVCFEVHCGLGDSGQNNGVFEFWVNGVQQIKDTDVQWFSTGWDYVNIPHNHNVFDLSGDNPHDVDDVAIAIPGYEGLNQDADGDYMIGPLDWSVSTGKFSGCTLQ